MNGVGTARPREGRACGAGARPPVPARRCRQHKEPARRGRKAGRGKGKRRRCARQRGRPPSREREAAEPRARLPPTAPRPHGGVGPRSAAERLPASPSPPSPARAGGCTKGWLQTPAHPHRACLPGSRTGPTRTPLCDARAPLPRQWARRGVRPHGASPVFPASLRALGTGGSALRVPTHRCKGCSSTGGVTEFADQLLLAFEPSPGGLSRPREPQPAFLFKLCPCSCFSIPHFKFSAFPRQRGLALLFLYFPGDVSWEEHGERDWTPLCRYHCHGYPPK